MPTSAPARSGQTESPAGVVSAVAADALFASLWIALSDAALARAVADLSGDVVLPSERL